MDAFYKTARWHVRGTPKWNKISWRRPAEGSRGQATALGICGWVKNCEDGSVRMLLQGERAAVEKLLDILREGTVWIAVDQLLTEQVPWEAYPKEGSFWIRY